MPVTCARTCTLCSGTVCPTTCSTTGMGCTRATVVSTVNSFGSLGPSAGCVQAPRCNCASIDRDKETAAVTRGVRRFTCPSSIRDPLGSRSRPCPNRFHLNPERDIHVESVLASNGDTELRTIECPFCICTADLTLNQRMIGEALERPDGQDQGLCDPVKSQVSGDH